MEFYTRIESSRGFKYLEVLIRAVLCFPCSSNIALDIVADFQNISIQSLYADP